MIIKLIERDLHACFTGLEAAAGIGDSSDSNQNEDTADTMTGNEITEPVDLPASDAAELRKLRAMYQRTYYHSHKEKCKQYQKKWRERNPDKVAAAQLRWLRKQFPPTDAGLQDLAERKREQTTFILPDSED